MLPIINDSFGHIPAEIPQTDLRKSLDTDQRVFRVRTS